jgi:hypothetical protein
LEFKEGTGFGDEAGGEEEDDDGCDGKECAEVYN